MVDQSNRGIRIQESAVGSAIVSGDGNTIYVIHQTTQQQPKAPPIHRSSLAPTPTRGWPLLQSRMATATLAAKPRGGTPLGTASTASMLAFLVAMFNLI